MKRFLAALSVCGVAAVLMEAYAQERVRAIDAGLLERIKVSQEEVFDERIKEVDMLELSMNAAVVGATDTSCTYRVPTQGITDQMESGRCWLFSTLNILRADMIGRYALGEFEFSQTYGQFYDILEKSNRFLENVIEYRGRPMDSRVNEWLFRKPVGDGGHFVNAAHIISKYGLVPQEVMPEVHSSLDNARLMSVVRTLLRRYGLMLREVKRHQVQEVKEQALRDVYRLLVNSLGKPPQEFCWTLRDREGNILSERTYTPHTFRDTFVDVDLEKDYVILMDDPTRPYYKMYEVDNSRNCHEMSNWTFLNLPAEKLSAIGTESLKGGEMFYVSCDTAMDALQKEGIYDTELYDLEGLLGISLDMSKVDMVRSCEIRSYHAMAVAGVKLAEDDGKPSRWLVENSFGTERGWGGFVVMSADWFETYIFRMAVRKDFLPEELLPLLDRRPKSIPSWNPTY